MPSKKSFSILVVDDDLSFQHWIKIVLGGEYELHFASSGAQALDFINREEIDLVLLDIQLGPENGLELIQPIKSYNDKIEIIMITVVRELTTAVEAIKAGAYDYITKDSDPEKIKLLVDKACEKKRLKSEVVSLIHEVRSCSDLDYIIKGSSPAMQEIHRVVDRIATMPSSVLIEGESGTGKEIIARRIHQVALQENPDLYTPFVCINIASIPQELLESTLFGHEKGSFTGASRTHRGKFELADGGTLFLDEIGELKLELQAKILRALQEKEIERVGSEKSIKINVRIIAATNRHLAVQVKKGLFREDLYYRLNVIPGIILKKCC